MQELEVITSRWISVEEHLPEDGRKVMVCGYIRCILTGNSTPEISVGFFNPKKGWRAELVEVEYWTDLPHLPIKGKQEDSDA